MHMHREDFSRYQFLIEIIMLSRRSMCSVSVLALIFVAGPAIIELPGAEAGMCGCPPLWTGFNDHCYRFFTSANISWFDAELTCRTFSTPCGEESSSSRLGHLVSIHSQDEMDFIVAMYESLRSKRPTIDIRTWIGLHERRAEASLQWADGTDFNYTSWAPSQPNDQSGSSDCVFFSKYYWYKWNDNTCSVNNRVESFICKIRQW
ncbi:echinoidin [Strongylocentrotus purpuratus]|uniref:C-type lectin domain-containing protein n=1 Tax=Strongylocentrotus purpuratus TaxID=7668 RepID=A0A7M7HG64_STRPU|nr:echinoidin [Strongylocentrotus purpuratus]|eukprot:XP_011665348.1 PREDICTED: echinoidin isoform X1 [Strongylocentrotus purpuratus]